ncbi:hypothetical protein TELCIR_12194 [Teladorsagia circumcincta]|uniref:Nonsense-mediated mRNA decay factor SMG8 n=1 Tax=Teladorsagia circumcincta TaxID=45464 RepID=A0A2G9U7E1_TELCI|nr:hypothetical protein TELCIR_12194 [Teladorsagia circumcincta]
MAVSSGNDSFLRALRLEKWLEQAENFLSPYLEKKVVVVGLVGKDSLNRAKGEDLNDLLRMDVFPRWTDPEDTMSREICDKLEHNLESQIYSVLKCYRLVEQSSGDSLGYVPENDAFVNVMQPVLVNVNPLADILQIALGKDLVEDGDDKSEKTPSFTRFLRTHIDSLRASKSKIYEVHPAVGDASVDPSAWEMHSNDITYLSTCSCGRRQAVRRDPFTLKEANYDFYFENKVFSCCAGLEKHVFAVLEDDDTDVEKGLWPVNDNWDEGEGGGSNPLFPVTAAMSRDRQNSAEDHHPVVVDEEEGTGSDTGEDSVSNAEPEPIESSSQSSQDDDVHYRNTRSYLDDEAGWLLAKPENVVAVAI